MDTSTDAAGIFGEITEVKLRARNFAFSIRMQSA